MIQTVIKRDGRIVGFNEEKIATAIRKAMLHTENGEDRELVRQITDHISFKGDPQMTLEAIQDAVELELMNSSRKDVAQKYIAYRNQRSIARKAKTRDMFLEIINIKSNDITRENANMNADTPAGMMMKFSSETTKPFVDDYLLSEEVKEAVENNYLHIHDKDCWHDSHQIPFSMSIDFDAVVKALKDINYSGYFTLEASSYLEAFTPETTQKGLCDLAASAKRLSDMFEAL